ncbi:MAG: hypothetical protein J6S97_08885 [Bacteroidales bacterium]|nr:hypothetical protein [Bacteroidales bacterium]
MPYPNRDGASNQKGLRIPAEALSSLTLIYYLVAKVRIFIAKMWQFEYFFSLILLLTGVLMHPCYFCDVKAMTNKPNFSNKTMKEIIRAEYYTPKTTVYIVSVYSVICVSQRPSVESFEEDDELVW